MSNEIAISVKNISKKFLLPHEKNNSVKSVFTGLFNSKRTFSNQQALKNISFEIKKGEFFGIVGRNGSGKSTLLKIIAGIYQPTKGKVMTNGKLVPFIELGVGFNPELTGRENVFLNGALLGFTRTQINANYNKIVEFAELQEFMDQKLKNYSSGMQVRLAFACATMAEADILLIDEVLAVGDAEFQRKCFNYFKQIKKFGTTVIFVTHDMTAVREYCDRAMLITDSKISTIATPEVVAMEYIKLFSDNKELQNDNLRDMRWGDSSISYFQKPLINIKGDTISITTFAKSKYNLDDVVFGFLIENSSGEPVIGTNSMITNTTSSKILKNIVVEKTWQFANLFSSGEYTLTLSMVSTDGATVYDWWKNVAKFRIDNINNTPYIISPNIELIEVRS